jgi:predicted DNA-binding protein YlxM (UPF0122 family)
MSEITLRERVNQLLSIYGNALSDKQREDLIDYYANDLSLSEIAINRKVSRNAVHLSIKEGIQELEKLESQLHIYQEHLSILSSLSQLKDEKDETKRNCLIEAIKEEINRGI